MNSIAKHHLISRS